MATPEYLVAHSGTNHTGDIEECVMISSTESVSAKNNTFQIKLDNPRNENQSGNKYKYSDVFSVDDDFSIHMTQGEGASLSRVFDGVLKEWNYDNTKGGRILTLKGNDLRDKLLNIQVFYDYSGNLWTASQIVEDVVNREINKKVDADHQILTTKIKSTAYVLPSGIAYDGKPVYEVIQDVSVDSRTRDGNYMFWIENSGGTMYLRWEPKPTTVDKQISEEECFTFNPQKNVYDIINFLYIYAGDDDDGNAIYTYAINIDSISDIGWKEKYWPYPAAAEMARGSNLSGQPLINRAKEIAKAEGQRRLDELSHPRWQADISVRGTTEYNLANRVFLYAPGIDWTELSGEFNSTGIEYSGFELRVDSITQEFSQKGWMTRLSLKEDAGVTA
jgi:hypothetical protein